MTHAPVFTGDGHYCPRCNQSWDQGDPQPADCRGGEVVSLGPPETVRRTWIGAQLTSVSKALAGGREEISALRNEAVDTI